MILLTFLDILLLFNQVVHQLLLVYALFFLLSPLQSLGLRWLSVFKHREIVPEAVVVPSQGFALAFLNRLRIFKRRPTTIDIKLFKITSL